MNSQKDKIFKRLTYDLWRRTLPRYIDVASGPMALECGTGPGSLLALLEIWFPKIRLFGLDIDSKTIHSAKEVTRRTSFLAASAESLPFADKTFEMIISLHMVEHLQEPELFFREASRVLRSGGMLIFATPNPAGIGARVMKSRWSGLIADHISLYPPDRWQQIMRDCGFSVLRDGTTGLSTIPAFRKFPLALLNWGLLFVFGFFPWRHGEAYVCISEKEGNPCPGYR